MRMRGLLLGLLVLILASCTDKQLAGIYRDVTLERGDEVEGFSLGIKAYTWGWTATEMYRWLDLMVLDDENPRQRPFNAFYHDDQLAGPDYKGFDIPNVDTLYSYAWLDVSEEPAVVTVPQTDAAYYSLQFIDFYSEVIDYIGTRQQGSGPQTIVISHGDYDGELPEGANLLVSPTRFVLLLARVLVESDASLANAQAVQAGWRIQPLSYPNNPEAQEPLALPRYKVNNAADYYAQLQTVTALVPPKPKDLPHWQALGRLNLGKGGELGDLRPELVKSFEKAFELAPRVLDKTIMLAGSEAGGGWAYSTLLGRYGGDYVQRSAVTGRGFGAHLPEEATYYVAYFDSEGAFLNGKRTYRIDFPGAIPAQGFWSMTLYGRDSDQLVANTINRYAISDRTPGIERAADGSFSVWVGNKEEGAANWLPAPSEPFYLALRLYIPEASVYEGAWRPPEIQRVE